MFKLTLIILLNSESGVSFDGLVDSYPHFRFCGIISECLYAIDSVKLVRLVDDIEKATSWQNIYLSQQKFTPFSRLKTCSHLPV